MRTGLVAVWATLAVLVTLIAAIEQARRPESGGGESGDIAEPGLLLPFRPERLGAIELAHAGRLHRFERDRAGVWSYHGVHTGAEGVHAHAADPVMARRLEFAFAAFGRTRIERRVRLDSGADRFGVTAPALVVLVYRAGEPRPAAQFAIGDLAPDTFSRYVLRAGSGEVVTIPNYQVENLLALVR
jgi:hypothetical protein